MEMNKMLNKYSVDKLMNEKLLDELETKGAIIIKNINPESIDRIYRESIKFFNSSLRRKCFLEKEFGNGYSQDNLNSSVREMFDFSNDYDAEEEKELGLKQNFPALELALANLYSHWYPLCHGLFKGSGQGFLNVFKYHANNKIKFRIPEHTDNDYIVSFVSKGEPLEIFIDRWYIPQLNDGEALLFIPRIKHRVSNKLNNDRYAITFAYPQTPV